ncbi:unnamed protein product [Adineta ricciae]|uniref:SAM domain-containing protein n=1 Tax=Adineta ricciae TaxID=249248 RepID=A0A813VY34_ADIRI|nr:unnamed protein product [Adineta ricciae]CAF1546135.1 unnamed protein product [Adineta ricciae]
MANECSQSNHVFEYESKPIVTIHTIDRWSIRESLEPFEQNEKKSKRKQRTVHEKPDIHQWNVDDVCLFFISVLGTTCYTLLIKEHLIDGTALLLLEDKHLMNVFHMSHDERVKLLRKIKKLKIDHPLT